MSNLKTIRVPASMITDLYIDINVPVDVSEDDLSGLIRSYELIDGSWMSEHDGFLDGGWVWEEEYDIEFDPKAPDFTEDIKKLLKVKNDE